MNCDNCIHLGWFMFMGMGKIKLCDIYKMLPKEITECKDFERKEDDDYAM